MYTTPPSGLRAFDVNITVPVGFDDLSAAIVMDAGEQRCSLLCCSLRFASVVMSVMAQDMDHNAPKLHALAHLNASRSTVCPPALPCAAVGTPAEPEPEGPPGSLCNCQV